MRKALATAGFGAALLIAGGAAAHHSFAVYFDDSEVIEVSGEVQSFQFRNPHGTIELLVEGEDGETVEWKAETNAPVALRRRGWSRDSLEAGEMVTVSGWPARDGSHYMRMQGVRRADGSLVGTGLFGTNDD